MLMNRCSFRCLKRSFSWEGTLSLGTLEKCISKISNHSARESGMVRVWKMRLQDSKLVQRTCLITSTTTNRHWMYLCVVPSDVRRQEFEIFSVERGWPLYLTCSPKTGPESDMICPI